MSRKKKGFSWIEPAKQIKLLLPLLVLSVLGMVVFVQAQFVSPATLDRALVRRARVVPWQAWPRTQIF